MPLYEYQCDDCGLTFEVRQKFSDEPLDACRQCGGAARKLVSRTGFALKGSGWFDEGYAKEKSCPAPTAAKKESPACQGCPNAASA